MANEKRLIDANALKAELKKSAEWHEARRLGLYSAMTHIDEQPTVDVVEVVRCKDCIRRYDTDECPMCYLSGGQYVEYTSGNSYCSHGERKDGDGNGKA